VPIIVCIIVVVVAVIVEAYVLCCRCCCCLLTACCLRAQLRVGRITVDYGGLQFLNYQTAQIKEIGTEQRRLLRRRLL